MQKSLGAKRYIIGPTVSSGLQAARGNAQFMLQLLSQAFTQPSTRSRSDRQVGW
jgi:hypothetical protein